MKEFLHKLLVGGSWVCSRGMLEKVLEPLHHFASWHLTMKMKLTCGVQARFGRNMLPNMFSKNQSFVTTQQKSETIQ